MKMREWGNAGGISTPPPVNWVQLLVAQVSKPAVSPTSKSAGLSDRTARGFGNPRYGRFGNLRYGGSAKMRPVIGDEARLLLFNGMDYGSMSP